MKVVVLGVVWFGVTLGLADLVGFVGSHTETTPCYSSPSAIATSPSTEGELVGLRAQPVAEGLDQPSDMFTLPGQNSLFIVEKPGRIVAIEHERPSGTPVLDMSALVLNDGNEQGLITALPDTEFEETCLLYIFYTDVYGDSQLASVRVSGTDAPTADVRSLRHLLEIPQKQDWHQSGSMIFGPDGNLWVSIGDGGGIGDPHGYGQNPKRLEGSVLRIDVEASSYQIPPDNPFAHSGEGRPEVWAYGLRNPWRISIDEETGILYVPDVGQNSVEEINVVDWRDPGLNFGWSITEGSACYEGVACDTEGVTQPAYEYAHDGNGCAVIGGQVYRGRAIPELAGQYFFADFCSGWVKSLRNSGSGVVGTTDWPDLGEHRLLTSFASDVAGELYFMTLDGGLWKITPVREGITGT